MANNQILAEMKTLVEEMHQLLDDAASIEELDGTQRLSALLTSVEEQIDILEENYQVQWPDDEEDE